jgi:hypothetical protein
MEYFKQQNDAFFFFFLGVIGLGSQISWYWYALCAQDINIILTWGNITDR